MLNRKQNALPEATADVEKGKSNLDEYGLTIHKNFLSDDHLRILKDRLEEQAEMERELGLAVFSYDESERNITSDVDLSFLGKPMGLPKIQEIVMLANKGRAFLDLASHPIALEYAKHTLHGIPFNIGAQHGAIIRQGAPAQSLHIDQHAVPFQTPVPMSVNVMVALDDFTEEMGATRVVPGSHKLPFPANHEDLKGVDTVAAELEPGSALIWESRTWHGQGASISDKVRYSVLTGYVVFFIKPRDNHPACLQDSIYDAMSDSQLALYDFYFNENGRIGPRNAEDNRRNVGYFMPYVPELHRG